MTNKDCSILINGHQLCEALSFLAPDNTEEQLDQEVIISTGGAECHSGPGLYCWLDEYPEEGAIKLDGTSPAALSAAPAAGVPEIPVQWAKSLSHCWPQCLDEPDGDWCVGTVDEDGHFYEVLLVEAAQYDAPGESQKIAEAIVALWSFADAPTPPASEQQHDGRMPSDSRNRMWELIDAALLGTVPDGLKRGDICNILAPLLASEQQRAVVMPERAEEEDHSASTAAILFALAVEEEHYDGMTFLRMWNEGEFEAIRRAWPDCPDEVFIGADPLFKPSTTNNGGTT